MKTCKKCKEVKQLKDFEHDKQGNICRNVCRLCRNKRRKEYGTRSGIGLKKYRLQYHYGLTLDQFNQMNTDQNGVCKICNRISLNKWGTELVVDHCHITGKVRGLLCDKCNKGLGQFEDNISVLEKAIQYLKLEKL
jgi:hypothetical protein